MFRADRAAGKGTVVRCLRAVHTLAGTWKTIDFHQVVWGSSKCQIHLLSDFPTCVHANYTQHTWY